MVSIMDCKWTHMKGTIKGTLLYPWIFQRIHAFKLRGVKIVCHQ